MLVGLKKNLLDCWKNVTRKLFCCDGEAEAMAASVTNIHSVSFYSSRMEEVPYELLYPAWTAKPLHLVKKQHINFSLGGEHTNGAKVPRGVKRSV